MSANELCIMNLALPDAGALELIEIAAEAGFDSIDVRILPVVGDRMKVAAIRRRLDETGIKVFGASSGWVTPQFDAAQVRPVLSTIAEVGGRCASVLAWESDRQQLLEHLALICAEAAVFGLQMNLEFAPFSAVRTIDDALALLAELRASNAKVLVDALHLARSGGTPNDVARLPVEAIAALQLCDAPIAAPPPEQLHDEARTDRRYPGEGELPLTALMAALPPGLVVEVETPVLRDRQLPLVERARRCADSARRFLLATNGTGR